tara:strand:- start:3608 stop:4039 length:432 start_codon:yes stop_codon:yes gene_type:complete
MIPRVVTPDNMDIEQHNQELFSDPVTISQMDIVENWENIILEETPIFGPPPRLTRSVAMVVPWDEEDNVIPEAVPILTRVNAEDGTEVSWSSDEEEEENEEDVESITSSENDFNNRCLELEREGNELLRQMNDLYNSLILNQQ